ncbi:netrin-4-like isoform X3 [Acipenser ruthenus]|uniref:netrin-4-like isoform X3 n=1 Tax=Acipenser ruthenus TaxID=7906 RepID=UPI0015619079|nr:netrin-4-like isoform X3 [Acipenser ruthenus]
MCHWTLFSLVALFGLTFDAGLGRVAAGVSHQCENQACNPHMGNLALGRKLLTESVCGHNSTELYCSYTENADRSCRPPKCGKCNAAHHQHSHLPAAMTDSSFRFPNTWWQSAEGVQRETIQLDLGTEFYFTHMIMVFKSPRPAAMLLERSQDFGKTWRPCKYYATNCNETFGLGDDTEQDGALCTTKYSGAFPCTRGEVHGKCICKHNTAGDHCQLCTPLYNDQPWQPADGITGDPHECKKCKCNGHADSCHFEHGVWLASGKHSGGVCDHCQHNTEGQHCQRCKTGFYRDPLRPFSAPDSCKPCACHPVGSVPYQLSAFSLCDPSNGECVCKPGVGGPHCDKCMVGYWGFGEYGCRPCDCAGSCDPFTGDCISSSSDVDWYHKSDYLSQHNETEPVWDWVDEQGFSALRHSGKCECKEQVLGNPKIFCAMKYTYVLKIKILSAHDKGSHVEVNVKVKKVLKPTKMKIVDGRLTLYPESWTTRGCTCPILNPGMEYLVAGHMDRRMGRLIVNMKSFVKPWKPDLGRKVMQFLKTDCKW